LHTSSNLINKPGLKGKADCPEFRSDFLATMVNVFEVIFASLFLEKIFLELNPVGIKFGTTVAL